MSLLDEHDDDELVAHAGDLATQRITGGFPRAYLEPKKAPYAAIETLLPTDVLLTTVSLLFASAGLRASIAAA
jgi:hypothetical protein